jgi:hypothetical protein
MARPAARGPPAQRFLRQAATLRRGSKSRLAGAGFGAGTRAGAGARARAALLPVAGAAKEGAVEAAAGFDCPHSAAG